MHVAEFVIYLSEIRCFSSDSQNTTETVTVTEDKVRILFFNHIAFVCYFVVAMES